MIAAFLIESQAGFTVHAVRVVVRESFARVRSHGYCIAAATDAGDGVFQIPEWVFDGRKLVRLPSTPTAWHVCEHCTNVVKALQEPPRG